jgi:hypothetical protein
MSRFEDHPTVRRLRERQASPDPSAPAGPSTLDAGEL